MKKVKVLSWLAGGNPHGCNVGIYDKRWSRGVSCGFVYSSKGGELNGSDIGRL